MRKIKVNEITKIRFNDFSNFDESNANNGGCYGFWTDFTRSDDGSFEVEYGTTADMEFCPCCGHFGAHFDYDSENFTCRDQFETVTEDELLEIIDNFEESDDTYIEIIQ